MPDTTRLVQPAIPVLGDRRVRLWTGLVVLEALALATYLTVSGEDVGLAPRYLVYPFVWINAGLLAVTLTRPTPGSRRHRLLAAGLGAGYLVGTLTVAGKLAFLPESATASVRVGWYAPGWGPLVAGTTPFVRWYLIPFEVVGYGALAYLVYANALAVSRGTIAGTLGLVTCVGCTVPVLAPLVGVLGGPAASLTTTAYAYSYDAGTAIFVLAVAMLVLSHRERLSVLDGLLGR